MFDAKDREIRRLTSNLRKLTYVINQAVKAIDKTMESKTLLPVDRGRRIARITGYLEDNCYLFGWHKISTKKHTLKTNERSPKRRRPGPEP